MNFIIGVLAGLIIGWNLVPQPKWIKAIYDRVSKRVLKWLASLLMLVVLVPGCGNGLVSADTGWAKERAVAEIAIASVTNESTPAPDRKPSVGDKCPDCNDPPGACGVGKVGDGRICDRCGLCNGDGRIDDRDVRSDPDDVRSEVQKEITLHYTAAHRDQWPAKWYGQQFKPFRDAGWKVRVVLEPESATKVPYFDVVAPDGEVFNFYDPITPKTVRHLETR